MPMSLSRDGEGQHEIIENLIESSNMQITDPFTNIVKPGSALLLLFCAIITVASVKSE